MRRSLFALLALCAGACARPTPPLVETPSGGNATILVFNIHAGKDAAAKGNLYGIAALARAVKADLVLLQEVDRGTKRSGGVDQVKVIADASGLSPAFGRSLDYDGGQYGIAAFSRAGIVATFTESLPVKPVQARSGGSHEPRAALVVVARTPLGNLTALNTHLDASREESYRLQEVAHVLGIVERSKKSKMPIVAGGDFNAEPGSEVHKKVLAAGLRDAWMECGSGDGFTYPADKPVKRIDYLFLTGSLRCTSARVIDTRISDHRPLLVTIR
jgi:endonuclease/exonuclease/phosphatase family metal-dependent hydrolase